MSASGAENGGGERLLIMEQSFARLGEQITAIAPDLAIQIFRADGQSDPGEPTIAWYNSDLYTILRTPAFDRFVGMMLASPRLHWVHTGAAGTDNPPFPSLIARGINLTTSHVQAVAIAEYVLAGVLDHFQRGPERRAAQAEANWARLPFREVAGSRWLVVGFGAIGQAVAKIARPFGASITAVRRAGDAHPLADSAVDFAQLGDAVAQADVVVLALPLTPENRGLIGAELLARFAPGSVLVNVARGGLVDEAALLAALDNERPGHAILDVAAVEPATPDNPLWVHPKVALTAHLAGMGSGTNNRGDLLFLDNLRRYVAGESLPYARPQSAP